MLEGSDAENVFVYSDIAGQGILVSLYFVAANKIWRCSESDIYSSSSASLLVDLERRGTAISDRKASLSSEASI